MASESKLRKAVKDRTARTREWLSKFRKQDRAGRFRHKRTDALHAELVRQQRATTRRRDRTEHLLEQYETATGREKAELLRQFRESRELLHSARAERQRRLDKYNESVHLLRASRAERSRLLKGYHESKRKLREWQSKLATKEGGSGARALAVAKRAAAADAAGRRHSFYSQAGTWTVKYAVKGEPRGCRSDCSQFVTSCYYAAGLPDPNGTNYTGGFTGTLGAHGTRISREEAMHTPGSLTLFGTGNFHHVEMNLGDGTTRTVGHGSAPVDYGTMDLLSGPKAYVKY